MTLRLRPWQRDALDRFRRAAEPDFLAVATPGAGKTTFALAAARWVLESGAVATPRIVVVAPTSHLKVQWAEAAHRLGLALDPDWSPSGGLARDVHGLVTTYQQLATGDAADKLHSITAGGLVVLDEVHHAGDERAWGDAVRRAAALAERRLCVSGTPFRSDTAAIPFVRYDDGEAEADYVYGYGEALADGGVVRPVYFPRVDGLMEWSAPDGSVMSASFHDELARNQVAQRLRAALSLDGDWIATVLGEADHRLRSLRMDHRDAGGLVIAMDTEHARGIARLMRHRLGIDADVVVSDDPSASARIAEFSRNDRPWLIAVRMVSEGVDIPRLRVGVYATTVATELFFRQAVGRFVRWQAGRAAQQAYVYVPDDPRLRAHAFSIAEARRHVLRPPTDDGDRDAHDTALDDVPAEALVEQLSLFSVLSAVATGTNIHAVTPHGLRFDDEPVVPEPVVQDDPELLLALPPVPTESGYVPGDGPSLAELKDQLRVRNAELAKRIVDFTGWSHARVHAELNRLAGVGTVAAATAEQLERRGRAAEGWLARLHR